MTVHVCSGHANNYDSCWESARRLEIAATIRLPAVFQSLVCCCYYLLDTHELDSLAIPRKANKKENGILGMNIDGVKKAWQLSPAGATAPGEVQAVIANHIVSNHYLHVSWRHAPCGSSCQALSTICCSGCNYVNWLRHKRLLLLVTRQFSSCWYIRDIYVTKGKTAGCVTYVSATVYGWHTYGWYYWHTIIYIHNSWLLSCLLLPVTIPGSGKVVSTVCNEALQDMASCCAEQTCLLV